MPLTKVSHKFQVEKSHEIVMKKEEDAKPLSLKNLKGLGKEIWKDIDVDEYIIKERESWWDIS